MHIPYFYIIKNSFNDKLYAGSRIAKNCHPSDLLVSYFTSSRTIRYLIKKHGIDIFTIVKIRTFSNMAAMAENYESRFLKKVDARNNNKFYNQHNNTGSGFNNAKYISVKDANGNMLRVEKDDPEIGVTLFGVNKGRHLDLAERSKKSKYNGMVIIDGIDYGCIRNAATKLGVTERKIKNYIESGTFNKPRDVDYQSIGEKISKTKSSMNWKNTIGKRGRELQVKNTDYAAVGCKISKTRTSPEWKSANTFICDICAKEIIGKGNLSQHNKKCEKDHE